MFKAKKKDNKNVLNKNNHSENISPSIYVSKKDLQKPNVINLEENIVLNNEVNQLVVFDESVLSAEKQTKVIGLKDLADNEEHKSNKD